MLNTTIGKLVVEDALPEDMRDWAQLSFNKKTLGAFMADLAQRHPDKYRDVTHKLLQIARQGALESGSNSFGLKHIRVSPIAKARREKLLKKVEEINNDDSLSDEQRNAKLTKVIAKSKEGFEAELMEEAKGENSPLERMISSGARGNPGSLASLRGGDFQYVDSEGHALPVPIAKSYGEGLDPVSYWAGSFGARQGLLSAKFSTAESGYFAKRLQQAAHRLLVTGVDEDHDREEGVRGMPASSDDPHNEGSLLAHPAGGYRKNTILTPKILQDLQRRGIGKILVRSPIVGGAKDGGLLARDVGIREGGDLPQPGSLVGLLAAQSIAERLSQQALGAKHLGGIAGKGVEQLTQGFPLVEQLVDIPGAFKGGATHAQTDGVVQLVHEAPAGGMYVKVNDHDHYVPMGHAVSVKRGDSIEAGDMLSSGIPNPSEIVKHKGIGEGRRYFTHQLAGVLQQAGVNAHRRNVELVARAMIDHVKMNDEFGDWLPGDVVSYQTLERNWQPRPGSQQLEPKAAVGKYLEKPVLHYTVGTKIQPSMLTDMDEFGVKSLAVHDKEPPFEPLMIRSQDSLHHDPDWVSQMYGSGLKKNLLKSVHRGAVSDEKSTSFVPSLAKGVNFGLVEPFSKINKKMGEEKQAFGPSSIPNALYNYGVKPLGRDVLAPSVIQTIESAPLEGVSPGTHTWSSNSAQNPDDWAARYLFQQGLGPGSKTELNNILNTPFSVPNADVENNVYVDPKANILTRAGQGLAAKGMVGGSYASALNNTAVNIAEAPAGVGGQATVDSIKGTLVDPLFQSQSVKQYNDLHSKLTPYSGREDFQNRFHAAERFANKYLDQERNYHDTMGQVWDADNGTGQSNLQKFRAMQAPIVAQYARGEIGPLQFQTALREAHQNNGLGYYDEVVTPEDFAALEQAAPNLKPEGGLSARHLNETQTAFEQKRQNQIAALSKPQTQQAIAAAPPQSVSPQSATGSLISSEFNKPILQAEAQRKQQKIEVQKQQALAQQNQELETVRQQNPVDPYTRSQQYAAQFSIDHPGLGLGGNRQDEIAREHSNNQAFLAQHQVPKLNEQEQVALQKARDSVTPDMMAKYGPGSPSSGPASTQVGYATQKPAPSAKALGSAAAMSQPPKIPTPPKMTASNPISKLPLVPGGKS